MTCSVLVPSVLMQVPDKSAPNMRVERIILLCDISIRCHSQIVYEGHLLRNIQNSKIFRIWVVGLFCFKLQYLRSIAVSACEWQCSVLEPPVLMQVPWWKAISICKWRRGISMWHPYCIIWCHSQYYAWRSSWEISKIINCSESDL